MTLGKRIAAGRKKLGMTQEQLAERLGVTAQAVSKWENDASCPDISTLPRLAQLLDTSVDALLGSPTPTVHTETKGPGKETAMPSQGYYDPGRRSLLSFAIWVIGLGGLLLVSAVLDWDVSFWNVLWSSALLGIGLHRMFRRFSFFALGCVIFGGYFLLDHLGLTDLGLSAELIFPIILVILGLSLLMDALKRPKLRLFSHNCEGSKKSDFEISGDRFRFASSFGEQSQTITMPKLSGGEISVSFGDHELDFREIAQVTQGCVLDARCSFGELRLIFPSSSHVKCEGHTAFASIETVGHPDPDPEVTIHLKASVSFGEIQIIYR